MTFIEKFTELKEKYGAVDESKLSESFAIQVEMTDEDCGGKFYVAYVNGVFAVEPYDYHDRMIEKTEELLPEIHVVSSSVCAIDDLKEALEKQNLLNDEHDPERICLVTADPDGFKKTAAAILDEIEINLV